MGQDRGVCLHGSKDKKNASKWKIRKTRPFKEVGVADGKEGVKTRMENRAMEHGLWRT